MTRRILLMPLLLTLPVVPAPPARAGLAEDIAHCEGAVLPRFGGWSPGRQAPPATPRTTEEFYCLGLGHWTGRFLEKNDRRAAEHLRRAADQNHAGAQGLLGFLHSQGRGVPRDQAQAIALWRKAAAQGHADSLNALAVAHDNGQGVPQDRAEATRLYRLAAERGSQEARRTLAGREPAPARSGQAEFDEGVRLYKARDHARAAQHFRRAADLGHPRAQLQLGYQSEFGEGLPLSLSEAARWYARAAAQGHAVAQSNLGAMYEEARGVKEDWVEAARWYRKSAEQGDATGQFQLGRAYEFGIGVVQNRQEAIRWYLKAGAQGHQQAAFAARHLQSPDNHQFRNAQEQAFMRKGVIGSRLMWKADPGVMFRNSRERWQWLARVRQQDEQADAQWEAGIKAQVESYCTGKATGTEGPWGQRCP